jgi:peptidyl-prolyl cis-trans isomerase D
MLQTLREKITGWVAVVIVGILIVPFALVGIQNYQTSTVADYVAKVGDVEISQAQFSQRLEQQRNQMRSMMGERFDPSLVDSVESKRRLLDNMIDAELLRQGADVVGCPYSARATARRKLLAFRGVSGGWESLMPSSTDWYWLNRD